MTKGYDNLMAHSSHIIANLGGEWIIATWETRGFLGSHFPMGLQVVVVDTNMKVLRQVKLPDTRFSELVFASYVDGKAYVLYRNQVYTQYYRAVIDPKSMTLESCEKIIDNLHGENLDAYSWEAKSDNGLFYALAGVFVNTVSKEMVHRQLLLDEKFEVLWEKRYAANDLSQITVDNDGVMSLFGYRYDKKSGETIVTVNILDVDDEHQVVGRVSVGEVYRLCLLNMTDNHAVAAGFIRTPESPKKSDCFDKMVGMSLNLRTKELKAQTIKFTSDELNVFGNKSLKKENKVGMVDALAISNHTGTDYGGVMLLQRIWKVTTHSTKVPDVHDYFTMGYLALAVDTTGTILWHLPFRSVTTERTGQNNDIPCYGDAIVIAEGNTTYIMLPEAAKTTPTYDISSTVSKFMLGTRVHSYAIYGIDKEGKIAKQVLVQKDKTSLMDNFLRLSPGHYISIHSFYKKSAFVHVDF